MPELIEILPLVAILSLGIFVQAAAGFAGGLLVVPCMLWAGYTIPQAQAALLVATIPQNIGGVWSFRDHVDWRRSVWPGAARLLFLPLGIWTLHSLQSVSVSTLKQLVGGVVLVATLATMLFRPTPRENVSAFWAWLAFPSSGYLQGLVGMGGPAMVFWVQAHDWDTRRSRAFLFCMYLISIVPAVTILALFFGRHILRPGLIAAATIPWLIVVTQLGLRAGTRLGKRRLRTVTLGLLLLLGVSGLASPWMERFASHSAADSQTSFD